MNETPIPPRQTPGGRDMPARLEAIILRSLAKQKVQRYPAASALREDIVSLLATMDTGLVNVKSLVASAQIATPMPARVATPTPGRTGIPIGVAGPNAPSAPELMLDIDDNTEPKPVETRLTIGDLRASGSRRRPVRLAWIAVAAIAAAAIGVVVYRYTSRPQTSDLRPQVAEMTAAREAAEPPRPEVRTLRPDPVRVSFSSDPAGADVFPYGSDARICTTPCSTDVDPDDGGDPRKRTFILRKGGFVEHTEDVSLTEGPASIHAILLAPERIPSSSSDGATRRRDRDRDRDRDRGDRAKPEPSPSPVATPAPTPSPGSDKIDRTETLDPFQNKGP
jgi:hypothetical protein